jgi:hypothetical protein
LSNSSRSSSTIEQQHSQSNSTKSNAAAAEPGATNNHQLTFGEQQHMLEESQSPCYGQLVVEVVGYCGGKVTWRQTLRWS